MAFTIGRLKKVINGVKAYTKFLQGTLTKPTLNMALIQALQNRPQKWGKVRISKNRNLMERMEGNSNK